GRFVKKQVCRARKSLKAALRFARKKQTYPSKKTAELMNALEQIDDELTYTQKAIRTAFAEAETILTMIRREKVGDVIPLVERARRQFQNHDLQGGMDLLKEAQAKLGNHFLPQSRKAALGGLDSDVKQLKQVLLQRRSDPAQR
ncbi:MAG TPA: hypothetical protein VLT88_07150, partial [Desulfosarcina sp.]|nr:hypothetical protein [Desulfosarcina sp.]